ncbi:MAG: site-specific DNA-methyltransferase, partial [Clostridia bacterium]|nr:site-specific DNA-methyltransferase [Clostridia bacterium]
TTGAVAKRFGREYIGIDINERFCKKAQERIDKVSVGSKKEIAKAKKKSEKIFADFKQDKVFAKMCENEENAVHFQNKQDTCFSSGLSGAEV